MGEMTENTAIVFALTSGGSQGSGEGERGADT